MIITKHSDFDGSNLLHLDAKVVAEYCGIHYMRTMWLGDRSAVYLLMHFGEGGDVLEFLKQNLAKECVIALHSARVHRVIDNETLNMTLRITAEEVKDRPCSKV